MKILYCESKRSLDSLIRLSLDFEVEYWGCKYTNKEVSWFERYDVVLCSNFTSPAMFNVMLKARASGAITVFLTDGIYDLANSFRNPNLLKYKSFLYDYSVYDYILALGPIWISDAYNSTKILQYIPRRVMNLNKEGTIGLKREGIKRVLITTANTAYFDERERDRLVVLINDITECLCDLGGVEVIFRIFDESILDLIDGSIENCVEGSFEKLIESCTHVITTPSSISLPVIQSGIPLMHMIIRSEVPTVFAGWQVFSREVFLGCMNDFLNSYSRKVEIQTEFFRRSYSEVNEDFWEKIEKDITEGRSIDIELKKRVEYFYSSKMNINFEYALRKLGEYFRATSIYKFLRNWIR